MTVDIDHYFFFPAKAQARVPDAGLRQGAGEYSPAPSSGMSSKFYWNISRTYLTYHVSGLHIVIYFMERIIGRQFVILFIRRNWRPVRLFTTVPFIKEILHFLTQFHKMTAVEAANQVSLQGYLRTGRLTTKLSCAAPRPRDWISIWQGSISDLYL